MQEHPLYKTTPEQGWSQMQPILDKAMPVEHRSRRFIVLWSAAVAAIILTVSTFILLKEKTTLNGPKLNQTPAMEMTNQEGQMSPGGNQSTAPISSVKTANENPGYENDAERSPEKPETKEPNFSASKGADKTPASSKTKLKSGLTRNDNVASALSNNEAGKILPVMAIEDKRVGNVIVDTKEVVQTQMDIQNSMATNESVVILRKTTSLEFLPVAEAWSHDAVRGSIGPVGPGKYQSTRRVQAFSPNISIAGIVGSQNGLGMHLGIGTDYAINSRLSLTANMGYRSYKPDVLHIGNSNKDAMNAESDALLSSDLAYAGIDNYIVGERVNASADYNALNPFVESIHQWQASAGLKYAITKRFFLEGGVGLGFDTKAKSEYPIATFGSVVSVPDANFQSTFDSYDVIRPKMTSIYGGTGYKLTRHFDFFAQWTYGLDHYIINDQSSTLDSSAKRSDYIRGLNAGVRYSL